MLGFGGVLGFGGMLSLVGGSLRQWGLSVPGCGGGGGVAGVAVEAALGAAAKAGFA